MKTILVVHSSGGYSGGEAISLNIYQKLKNTFNFVFFIPKNKKRTNLPYKIQASYSKNNNFCSIIKNLKKTIKEASPEIIHTHGTKAALYTKLAIITSKNKPKFFYTIHGFHIFHKKGLKAKFFLLIEKITNGLLVDKIICVGENDFNILKNITKNKNSVNLIKNGINENKKNINTEIEKIKSNCNYLIGTISRLHYQKDIETLIQSANEIKDNTTIVIIGSGPEEKKLKQLTQKLNLQNKIIFLGNIENASSLIHYFDAFVLSTKWEGLPLVILEAMLSKIPVIGSSVHGVKELIEENKTGFLFKQGDYKELAKKINHILENKNNLEYITNTAYNMVKNQYSEEEMINEYKKLYLE